MYAVLLARHSSVTYVIHTLKKKSLAAQAKNHIFEVTMRCYAEMDVFWQKMHLRTMKWHLMPVANMENTYKYIN